MTLRQASQTLRPGRPLLAALLVMLLAVPAVAQTRDPQPAPRDRGDDKGGASVRIDPMSVVDSLRRAAEERQRRRREAEARERERAERERIEAEQAAAREQAAIDAQRRAETEAEARRQREAERVAAQATADAAAARRRAAQRPVTPRRQERSRPAPEPAAPPAPVEAPPPVVAAQPVPIPAPAAVPALAPPPPAAARPASGPGLGTILVWLASGAALLIAAVAVGRVMQSAFGPKPRAVARPDRGEASAPEGLKPPAASARVARGGFDTDIDYPARAAGETP